MKQLFDGSRRWVTAIAVFIGLMAGFAAPGSWHIVVRVVLVGTVTGACCTIVGVVLATVSCAGTSGAAVPAMTRIIRNNAGRLKSRTLRRRGVKAMSGG